MRLAGLVSFADWIGSNIRWFKFERQTTDLAAFYGEALDCARQALEDIGWPQMEKCTIGFQDLFGFPPRPLQGHTQKLLSNQSQPTLLLIEDQMGSGKTEAALYASLMLQNQVGHRGFYVALPTQATGNAMFERVGKKYLSKLGYTRPPDLQLIHGAALLDKRFEEMRLQIGEEAQHEQSVVAHEWFSHRKHGLLSPHAVGTVDQTLLSILNVGHHFVRLWGLGNRVVILDEVHAYELYTSTLIERLLAWLKAMNSSVILLSATLPEQVRHRLLKAWDSEIPQEDAPYPRITKADKGKAVVVGLETRALKYSIQPAPLEVEGLAKKLVELSQGGGAIGCIVNTVSRAQALYKAVQARLSEQSEKPTLKLFHARFPAHQRKEIEDWVIDHLGKDNKALRRSIVIATQTLEQSIDADFDVLVSDLCPIDLLLQRAGRLHRHNDPKAFERTLRGSHAKPILYVSGLAEDYSSLDLTLYYWHMVYDRATLLRTWAVLRHRLNTGAMLSLPHDLQGEHSLIEKVYGKGKLEGSFGPDFEQDLSAAMEKLEEDRKKERRLAKDSALIRPERFFEHVPDDDRKIDDENPQLNKNFRAVTRLGEPSVTVVLLERREGKLYSLQGVRVSLEEEPTFAHAKELLRTAVVLSNREIFDYLADKPIVSWKESALLRHVRVLELEDKRCVIGQLEVRLDDELGVVYERR
ncbi:MAG: CRISPR-associated endonuclease/helicase Cas3 [Meiothermus sp.]|nr:MAG: CRISPR-associated endonuclease/helicase Cas3 [Meiothermus sp.]